MASVNKVILVGNLGRDPEVRYTASGTPVANFPLATSDRWTDQASGERKERTEWRKGRQVYVEGSLQTREWTDREGHKRYTTEVRAQTFQLLGVRPTEGGDAPERAPAHATAEPEAGFVEDDIPF